jgi:hypothetical protein
MMIELSKCGCGKKFKSAQGLADHQRDMQHTKDTPKRKLFRKNTFTPEYDPDWTSECEVCGQSPIVPLTGMCGPCTFGEADTVAGNW